VVFYILVKEFVTMLYVFACSGCWY